MHRHRKGPGNGTNIERARAAARRSFMEAESADRVSNEIHVFDPLARAYRIERGMVTRDENVAVIS